jgi:hypothetical protein
MWSSHFIETFSVSAPNLQSNASFVEAPREMMAGVDWASLTVNGHPMASILVFFVGITVARLGLSCVEVDF